MELRHYLRMLRTGWWLIALTTLSALAIALAVAYSATPIYRASARLIVRPNVPALGNASLVESLATLDKPSIAATYAEVLNSMRIFNEAANPLQLDPKTLLLYTRTAVVLPSSNILEVAVTGPDPNLATRLTNGIGQRAIEYTKGLYQAYGIEFLDPAVVPTEPISPQPLRDASLAIVLGFVLGAALAILREQLRMPLEALRRRNMYDPYSNAYSRRYFMRRLEEEITRKRGSLAVGLLQLDGLEGLNETLPSPVFHGLLRRVNRILQIELRGRDSIGRWGDIQFALLLPSTPGTAAARTLERVQQVLSTSIPLNENEPNEMVCLEPRIGVVASNGTEEANVLVERAEKVLERTLQSGAKPVQLVE